MWRNSGFITESASLLTQETYASSSFLVLARRMYLDASPAIAAIRSDVRPALFG